MILLNSSVQTEKYKAEIAFLKRKAKDDAKRLKGHFEEEEDPLAIKDTNENWSIGVQSSIECQSETESTKLL